ncbi:MAG TPA: flagellar hook-associated protein FlgL, partial [Thermoanaerobacter sp.]|nr:flagellar hook-associated protein FlgL [Thermoanaerobacter sp.]
IVDVDKQMENVLAVRAEVGAKSNRIDLIQNRLQDDNYNFTALLSKSEDADLAQVITNLKMDENVYRASLAAGARIMQPSLIDFLR